MAIKEQEINERYAVYNGDCMEVLPEIKSESIHFTIYSPPFSDLYNYSSSPRDLSNSSSYEEFMEHYEFLVKEIHRITLKGRLSAVHCMDIPEKGDKGFNDFPGDIIRLHQRLGFYYVGRRQIWKEPLRMAIRTRSKGLMHRQIVKDSAYCNVASADTLLTFRKAGENKVPIENEFGLLEYAGEDAPSTDLILKYKNWADPKTNKLSHFIWQRYASSVWMDIRIGNVLKYRTARDSEEEKHVCPLQLDVIDRCIDLWTNRGEKVLTPFMGVGSEVYSAVSKNRLGIGIELKDSYYRQAIKNIREAVIEGGRNGQKNLFETV